MSTRFHTPCQAVIDNVAAPCPNMAGPLSNYVCERCETRIVGAMHGALCRYGEFQLAHQLNDLFDNREWSCYNLRMEVVQ